MAVVTGGPAAQVREAFARLDKGDLKGFAGLAAEDGQGVDEVSRRWLRGRKDLAAYMSQLEGAVKDVRSELKDVHETIMGEVSLVTCWLEQDYTMDSVRQHISAPTTVVLRRQDGDWRIVLFHSIPLPPAS